MEGKTRRPSRISQMMTPIVNIGRKLSRIGRIHDEVTESSHVDYEIKISKEVLDIPIDFVSQMKEAFALFDKARVNKT